MQWRSNSMIGRLCRCKIQYIWYFHAEPGRGPPARSCEGRSSLAGTSEYPFGRLDFNQPWRSLEIMPGGRCDTSHPTEQRWSRSGEAGVGLSRCTFFAPLRLRWSLANQSVEEPLD